MAAPKQSDEKTRTEFLRRMSAGATDVVDRVIPFANDDVPKFLADLRRFEEDSRKVVILVR